MNGGIWNIKIFCLNRNTYLKYWQLDGVDGRQMRRINYCSQCVWELALEMQLKALKEQYVGFELRLFCFK